MSACKAAMSWIKSRHASILVKKSLQLAVSAEAEKKNVTKLSLLEEPRRSRTRK